MASRQDISAGRAFVELYVKNSPLLKGLSQISSMVKGVGTTLLGVGAGVAALGATAVASLGGAVAVFASMGSELADMAARTGETVGSLAELKFAAEQTGAGLEDVEKAIMTMQKKGIVGTFDQIAAKIAAIEDPAKRTQAAIENWGKAGTKLLPMVDGLQELRGQARAFGLVPTEQAVADADKIGDLFDQIVSIGKAAVFEIGAAVAPIAIPALEAVRTLMQATVLIAKQVPFMFQAVGDALGAVGGWFGDLRDTFGTTWGGIVDAIQSGDLALAGQVAWAGLVLVWEQSTQELNTIWEEVKLFFLNTWDQVVTGIATGFTNATAGVETVWVEVVSALRTVWAELYAFIMDSLTVIGQQVSNVFAFAKMGAVAAAANLGEATGRINKELADEMRQGAAQQFETAVTGNNAAAMNAIGDRDAAKGKALSDIAARRAAELARIEANRQGANGILGDGLNDRRAAREKARDDDIAAKKLALEAAKEDLKKVRAVAAAKPKADFGPLGKVAAMGIAEAAKSVGGFSAAGLMAAGRGGGNKQLNELVDVGRKQKELAEKQLRATERGQKAKPFQVGGVM